MNKFPWTVARLAARFTHSALHKAKLLALEGEVFDLKLDAPNGIHRLSASVQGSQSEPYATEIRAVVGKGINGVTSACTCPIGGWCKHVAAVLLTHETMTEVPSDEELVRRAMERWEQWHDSLDQPSPEPERAIEGQELFFALEAHPQQARFVVTPLLTALSKNGKRVTAQVLRDDQRLPPGLAREERIRCLVLKEFPSVLSRDGYAHVLSGIEGEEWLLSALQDGRVVQRRKLDLHWTVGEPREAKLGWHLQPDGQQRLAVDADKTRFVELSGLWYCDNASNEIGRASGEFPTRLVHQLQHAPLLPPLLAAQIGKTQRDAFQRLSLPDPIALETAAVAEIPPQPVAQLRLRKGYGVDRLAALRLTFDYGGVEVAAVDPGREVSRVDGSQVRRYSRDFIAEKNAQGELRKIGLTPAGRARFSVATNADPHDWVIDTWNHDDQVATFLQLGERLSREGFRVVSDDDFPLELVAAPTDWYADLDDGGGNAWFDLDLGIEINGERVSLLPILERAIGQRSLPLTPKADEAEDATWLAPLDERRRVALPLKRVRELIAPLLELFGEFDGERHSHLRVPGVRAMALAELQSHGDLRWRGSDRLQRAVENLRQLGRQQITALPTGFKAELRSYQHAGLEWLQALRRADLGGILADDMGLGKTIQLLAHLLVERAAGRLQKPALVVSATSVLPNWKREAERFAPELRVLLLHGKERAKDYESIADHDMVLTSYALLPRDHDVLARHDWSIIALDEAQAIKNPKAQAGTVARVLRADQRLALTGTPIENHLGELWSLLDFTVPGLLGEERAFTRLIRNPIEKHADAECRDRLARRIAPFILRRTKEQVASDLPAKTDIIETVDLIGKQRDLYESLRLAQHERVQQAIKKRGLAQSGIVVLDALLKLRQACCDPRLLALESASKVKDSAKLSRLLVMLEELRSENRRVLLFSQFTSMLDLIEPELNERAISFVRLDGSTINRALPVESFQSGAVDVFLLSLKAGGVGLNLTAADTVIHYDPWWNPAVEDQATDRAHRIGQDKPVFVFKLICQGTVEEKIQALKLRKAELAEALLSEGASGKLDLSPDDVEDLFKPLG